MASLPFLLIMVHTHPTLTFACLDVPVTQTYHPQPHISYLLTHPYVSFLAIPPIMKGIGVSNFILIGSSSLNMLCLMSRFPLFLRCPNLPWILLMGQAICHSQF